MAFSRSLLLIVFHPFSSFFPLVFHTNIVGRKCRQLKKSSKLRVLAPDMSSNEFFSTYFFSLSPSPSLLPDLLEIINSSRSLQNPSLQLALLPFAVFLFLSVLTYWKSQLSFSLQPVIIFLLCLCFVSWLTVVLLKRVLRLTVNKCIQIQKDAVRDFQPHVIIGSSFGAPMFRHSLSRLIFSLLFRIVILLISFF